MPSPRRTYSWPDLHLMALVRQTLVVCPECRSAGSVIFAHGEFSFQCPTCGALKKASYGGKNAPGRGTNPIYRGSSYDPVFGFPLWLQAEYRGNTLWAFSWAHLAFLEDAIAAELRPSSPAGARRLRNKLPKWMLLARNRAGLLKLIGKLREKNIRAR